MNPVKKILIGCNGLHYSQDYLCSSKEQLSEPLSVYLVRNGKVQKDITIAHSFVGYSPVVFAFHPFDEIRNEDSIDVVFSHVKQMPSRQWNKSETVGFLQLKRLNNEGTKQSPSIYFEAIYGEHYLTSAFHQSMDGLHNRWYNKKEGNVYLEGNRYRQVQIAYAVPRKISLITVGIRDRYNLFPTDLHGQVDDKHYIISLRHDGKACEQAMEAGGILLSDMQAGAFKKVYSLGKNHMQPLKDASAFAFSASTSPLLKLPLPADAVACKELQLLDSLSVGIHRLLLFKIVNAFQITDEPQTLVHVHNAYATWRHKKGLTGNYLFR